MRVHRSNVDIIVREWSSEQAISRPGRANRYTAGMATNSADPARSRSSRRWFQYRLRTLLILVAAIGAACAYVQHLLACYEAEWREEDATIARISALFEHAPGNGITVNRAPSGPAWLRALVPNNRKWVFDRVESVALSAEFAEDRNDTEQLTQELINFRFLKILTFGGGFLPQRPGHGDVDLDAVQKALPKVIVVEVSS